MPMIQTFQSGFTKMRTQDVTADDTAFDGSTKGARYTDITSRDVIWYDPNTNGIEIMFTGEAANNDTFGAQIWNITTNGLAEIVADITGAAGTAWFDFTSKDSTERLFMDSITITDEYHLKDVTVADSGNNRFARIGLDTLGAKGGFVCFHSIGGVGEVKRITPWFRFFVFPIFFGIINLVSNLMM